jgi:hypothetical protein
MTDPTTSGTETSGSRVAVPFAAIVLAMLPAVLDRSSRRLRRWQRSR